MNRLTRIITACIFILVYVASSGAQPADKLFQKGVQLYEQKQYEKALQQFLLIEEEGRSSFELYYNIGNCYYRLKENGWAVYYYEKARQLNPTDPDLQYNLELVNSQISGIIKIPPKFFLVEWWDAIFDFLSMKHILIAGLILLVLINIFFAAKIILIHHPISVYFSQLIKLSSIAFIILIFTGIIEYQYDYSKQYAIVIEDRIGVHSEPFDESNILFYVVGGQKAIVKRVLENDWVELLFPDGNTGWITSNQIRSID